MSLFFNRTSAEIASMMLGDELKIGHDPDQHAAYVKSWITILENDPKEIFRAATDAEKIREFVLALEQKQEIQQDTAADMAVPQMALPDLATITQQNNQSLRRLTENLTSIDQNLIYLVAEQFKFHRNGSIDSQEFEAGVKDKLGSKIPADWSGGVVVEGSAKDNEGYTVAAKQLGVEPQFWSVYVQRNSEDYELVEDFKDKQQADAVFEKLSLIDVVATKDEKIKIEKIAWINELRDGIANNHQEGRRQSMQTRLIANEPRQYLAVPYVEKDAAKKAGARWDGKARAWYIGELGDMNQLQQWLPGQQTKRQEPAQSADVEFTETLRSLGCIVTDPQQVKMNGLKQRIKVEGDVGTEKSGFYVGHLDGRPAGYIKNNRTGEEIKWKAKGYSFTPDEKAKLYADAAIKQQKRKAIETEHHNNTAQSIADLLKVAPFSDHDHPYLQEKQIRSENLLQVPQDANKLPDDSLIKIGKDWNESKQLREDYPNHIVLTAGDLLIPAQDINNKTWTVQAINSAGSKMFATGGKKESHFVVTGGLEGGVDALKGSPAIVIAEGYATADTLSQVLDYPTVAAFDSGNLKSVAEQLHQKYPDKTIIIAGDDDIKNTVNIGREKAQEAAEAVDGTVILPTFAPKEKISKGLSDFNDLANKSVLGKDAVKRQVAPIVAMKIKTMSHENIQIKIQPKQSSRKTTSR